MLVGVLAAVVICGRWISKTAREWNKQNEDNNTNADASSVADLESGNDIVIQPVEFDVESRGVDLAPTEDDIAFRGGIGTTDDCSLHEKGGQVRGRGRHAAVR